MTTTDEVLTMRWQTTNMLLAILLWAALPVAADDDRKATGIESLGHGIHWLRGAFVPGRQPDGNSIVLEAPQGLILIDTGRHPEHTRRLLDYAQEQQRPIAAIVNTHWHLDHVGGNPMIKAAFPDAHTHASTAITTAMDGFLAGYKRELQTQIDASTDAAATASWRAEIGLIDAGAALFPDDPVEHSDRIELAGRRLDLHLAQRAVTAGDVWIYDRRAHVLIAGDLVTLPAPFLDTACPTRWQATLKRLAKVRFTQLVPGHGAPMSRRQFTAYRRGFDGLLACAASDAPIAQCADEWLTATGDLIDDDEQEFTRQLVRYYVGEVLRGNPRRIASFCDSGTASHEH